jgi:hypothetical protein
MAFSTASKIKALFSNLFGGNGRSSNNVDGVGFRSTDLMNDMDMSFGAYGSDEEKYYSDMPHREMEGMTSDMRLLSRRHRYLEIDVLEEIVPEIDAGLNVYADEASAHNADGHVVTVRCANQKIKEELEFLLFRLINIDDKAYSIARSLSKYGDWFGEIVVDPENVEGGVLNLASLDPYTMWRIQTKRGKVLEFQQARTGPDYDVVMSDVVGKIPEGQSAKEVEMRIKWAGRSVQRPGTIRFAPAQVIHMALGGDRKGYAPYGVSIMVAAYRPARNLRMLEDSMLLYRLVRAPERRIYYVDLGQLPSNKAESMMQDFRNKIKRKKIYNDRTGEIDERYNPWSVDDDIFMPVRPGSSTRVETLPGACLDLETMIPLLDGRILSLGKIIEERAEDRNKQHWAYSCDPENGKIVPGMITWAGVTRKDAQVVRVTLDNGEVITCTPDHKFPIIGRGRVEAGSLMAGDSLVPFRTRRHRIKPHHKSEYHQVYDLAIKEWVFTHRMVSHFFKGTPLEQSMVFDNTLSNNLSLIHHNNFDRFNNDPLNLSWMDPVDHRSYHASMTKWFSHMGTAASVRKMKRMREEEPETYSRYVKAQTEQLALWRSGLTDEERMKINKKISHSLRASISRRSPEEKAAASQRLRSISSLGVLALAEKMKDAEFVKEFTAKQREGWATAVTRRPETHRLRGIGISKRTKLLHATPGYTEGIFAKERLMYPKSMVDFVIHALRDGVRVKDIISSYNDQVELVKEFISSNGHLKRSNLRLEKGLTVDRLNKLVASVGYKSVSHARSEASLYNHQVVSVELLDSRVDTGTLTIDGNEKFHGHHTFALAAGVFTYNSNLGEIDDAIYFRKKMYLAMGIPPGYLEQTIESQTNRLTLSSQAMVFAKRVYRIQRVMAKGLRESCERHLTLIGVPETLYEDLEISMTPPSEWREMAQAEVLNNRAAMAQQFAGTGAVSKDYVRRDILRMSDEEAEEEARRLVNEALVEAEVEAQKALIAARAQAEVERGASINQARTQAELAAATTPAAPESELPPGPTAPPQGPEGLEEPTIGQLAAAAPEPGAQDAAPTVAPVREPRRAPKRLDPADVEVEWEGR